MKIGFIGLGQMGSAMAANLLKAGHDVTVYNRSRDKAEALVGEGAKIAATVAEACGGEAVFTMLANDDALSAVVHGDGGLLASLGKGAIHISSSTISVALSERLTKEHAAVGQRFVSAPVFGRPEAAAAAKLFVAAAGEPGAIEAVTPLFEAIGQRTFVLGEEPKSANLVKLSGNFLIASVIESLGEAMALVEKGRGRPASISRPLTSTLFSAPVYKTYGGLIADRKFKPAGFAAPSRSKRHPPRTGRRRGIERAAAACKPAARPLPDLARPRRRGSRLVGGRSAGGEGRGAEGIVARHTRSLPLAANKESILFRK